MKGAEILMVSVGMLVCFMAFSYVVLTGDCNTYIKISLLILFGGISLLLIRVTSYMNKVKEVE